MRRWTSPTLGLALASGLFLATACTGGRDPDLQSSTALPTAANSFPSGPPVPTTQPPHDIVISAVGEVTFDPAAVGSVTPAEALAGIGDVFTTDDLTIVTLVCGVAPPDTLLLSAGPCTAEQMTALAAAGVDVVVLADDGIEPSVAENTIDAVTAAGMTAVGAGRSDSAAGPVVVDAGGVGVAIVAVSRQGEPALFATLESAGIADGRDLAAVARIVTETKAEADFIIVSVHWGVEQSQAPTADDEAFAQALIDAGADVVIGHGSHRLHRLDLTGGAPVFMSLGDFVASGQPEPTADTAIGRIERSMDGQLSACLRPATITQPGIVILDAPSFEGC